MIVKLKKGSFTIGSKKQVIGLKYYAFGEISDEEYDLLVKGGAAGLSTFMSYFILTAIASKDKKLATKIMKDYYGKMLDLGATTFWEDFDIDWLKDDPSPIDVMPEKGRKNVHADYGQVLLSRFKAQPLSRLVERSAGVYVRKYFGNTQDGM